MNLSLRSSGKDKCEDPDIELLKVLNELVEHENPQVRTYVNGTLYSIFTRKKLREAFKSLHISGGHAFRRTSMALPTTDAALHADSSFY